MSGLYLGKPIIDMSDADVFAATTSMRNSLQRYNERRDLMAKNVSIQGHRLNKMFGDNKELPPMNPFFKETLNNLENEVKKRTGVK